jgi:hypothetical protein
MRLTWLPLAVFIVAGCGNNDAQHGGGSEDLAVPHMAMPDLLPPPAVCNPNDPMTDGTPCSAGCSTGTIGVNLGGSCKCYLKCQTNPECSCNRLCDPLTLNDAGVGSACLPGNLPGQRCGRDSVTGNPFGNVFCSQLGACVGAGTAATAKYCIYKCTMNSQCPSQTSCQQYFDNMGVAIGIACAYDSGPNGNKDLGQTCTPPTDKCKSGQLCDGVCRPQCDGPGGTCASGTCTRLDDTAVNKVIGYVCK